MTDLTEAKRLVEAATPGPWHLLPKRGHEPRTIYAADDALRYIARCKDGPSFGEQPTNDDANAELIAWTATHLPTLIAEHEAALAMVRDLADELASELDGRYANMLDHPAMKHRYDRDMSTVVEARALLGDRS